MEMMNRAISRPEFWHLAHGYFRTVIFIILRLRLELRYSAGIHVCRLKVEVEARPYLSYLASIISVIETKTSKKPSIAFMKKNLV
jgi:hypothetical protein